MQEVLSYQTDLLKSWGWEDILLPLQDFTVKYSDTAQFLCVLRVNLLSGVMIEASERSNHRLETSAVDSV